MRPYIPVRRSLITVTGVVALASLLIFAHVAFAHESFFKPVIGDLDAAVPGLERVAVSEDGGVTAFNYQGDLLPNFPLWLDGFVPVSSPLIGNVVGDGQNEVMVVGRNDQNAYTLFAISSAGQAIAQANVVGDVYYDPVIVSQSNAQTDDVLVVSTTGAVQRFRFTNGQFLGEALFQLPAAAGISVVGTDVVVNYPESNTLEVYSEQNATWGRRSVIEVPSPVIYPVTATEDGKLLGVTQNGKLVSVLKATGVATAGFPVDLSSTAVGAVTLADVRDDNAGKEMLVDFADGTSAILRADGTVLDSHSEKNFMSLTLASEDTLSHASYRFMNSYSTTTLLSQQNRRLVSYLSRIKVPFVLSAAGEINLSINGVAQASGSTFALGTVALNDVRDITVLVENTGDSALQLGGPASVQGQDAALFSIATQPRLVIPGHTSSQVVVHFVAESAGVKTAQLLVTSNDEDEANYTLNLRASVSSVNLIRDGDMELAGNLVANWRNWGTAVFNKTNAANVSGVQSMYINALATHSGIQQLSVPVVAGHKYRYSVKYKLLSGTFNTWLGIRDSNRDFERKTATIAKFSPDWQTYSREFVVPANFVSDFRVITTIRLGEGYVDDVALEEIPNGPTPIVYDGDMEQDGLALWSYYGQPTIIAKSSAEAHSGTQSMHIVSRANYGFMQSYLPIISGRQYHLRMWYKNIGGTLLPRISTTNANEDFEFRPGNPLEPMLSNTNGQWVQYDRTFTAPANYAGVYRLIFMQSNADFGPPYRNLPQGEVYVDDVTIEEVLPQ